MLPYRLIVVLAPFSQAARDRITQQFERLQPVLSIRARTRSARARCSCAAAKASPTPIRRQRFGFARWRRADLPFKLDQVILSVFERLFQPLARTSRRSISGGIGCRLPLGRKHGSGGLMGRSAVATSVTRLASRAARSESGQMAISSSYALANMLSVDSVPLRISTAPSSASCCCSRVFFFKARPARIKRRTLLT